MKCLKCGYEFREGLFCPECGTKYDEEEAKRIEAEQFEAEEKKRGEEREKRELELARAKVEQEKLAVEKAAHEAELARQLNEKVRIEQEAQARMEEQKRKHQEEATRTFNGVIYNTIDEMNIAKAAFDEQTAITKATKKANTLAIWSFVLSLATYPLVMTIFLWFPSLILSIVFGVKALKGKTDKKGLTIAGLIVDGLFILIIIISIIFS